MPAAALIQFFLQHALGRQSRSTVLSPIIWMLSVSLSAFVVTVAAHAPTWASALLLVPVFIAAALLVWAYVYFAIKGNIDALRSEHFIVSRMEVERSRTGDDNAGFVPSRVIDTRATAASTPTLIEQAK